MKTVIIFFARRKLNFVNKKQGVEVKANDGKSQNEIEIKVGTIFVRKKKKNFIGKTKSLEIYESL